MKFSNLNKKLGGFFSSSKNIIKTIKLLWESSKLSFIATLIITVLNGIIVPINMVISKYLIDSVVNALKNKNPIDSLSKVLFWLIVEFGVITFSYIISRINTYFSTIQSKCLNNSISELLIKKANELDLSYFENDEFYNKIEKANSQAVGTTIQIVNALTQIVKNFTTLVGAIVIVFQLSPIILLLCIMTSIPMFIINVKIYKQKYNIYSKRIEKTRLARYLQMVMMDYVPVKEIKLNRIGNWLEKIILSIYKENLNQDKKIEKKQLLIMSIVDIFNTIISYGYKVYVIFITLTQRLSIGSMNMYISALTNLEDSVKNTLENFASLYSNNLYIENLFYVLDLKPLILKNNSGKKEFKNDIRDSIEFRNVSFKYPNSKNYALKNVSFKIEANENCAIVGLNGCGKTTLIKLLTRLYDPTEGEIYIDDINIKEFNIESLYKGIGIVFQDFMKYPFDVKKNIGFGNIDNLDNFELIKTAAKKANAYTFIQGLSNKFDTKLQKMWSNGVDLSLGQWQKLAISRAFMSNACLLILDEPTASIDAKSEYELFKDFKKLMGKGTSILISHRFSTVKMSDKIIVLKDGEIIEQGNHDSLIKNDGLYAELYNMQADAYLVDEDKNIDGSKGKLKDIV
ncbi:ABC transporter ATP-binding protein [Clostridium felsineum]|uniref:ABC transporter ATP-binding protein n=1 Tax=Clostridium felsineum TaxID=36839 RepID=UPI00098CB659|nr:ABC transporter ATP-binding protein [Clostridium felsineum]URZ17654.1 Vitamin B12 import ATP-binding protein BtuD [Clostridium felsineum DSM 794]